MWWWCWRWWRWQWYRVTMLMMKMFMSGWMAESILHAINLISYNQYKFIFLMWPWCRLLLFYFIFCAISSANSEVFGAVKAGEAHSRHMPCTGDGKDININFSQRTSDSKLSGVNGVGPSLEFNNPFFFSLFWKRKE